jgi:purine-binding chemotaxis protein CheW
VTQLCTFVVGALLLGLPIAEVQEVLRHQPLTRVPRAHPVVRGLVNLRGQILAALDLRRRLQLPDLPADVDPMVVVVRGPDGPAALLVDEIGDVVEVDGAMEPPPETLPARVRELTVGVHEVERRLLLVATGDRLTRCD